MTYHSLGTVMKDVLGPGRLEWTERYAYVDMLGCKYQRPESLEPCVYQMICNQCHEEGEQRVFAYGADQLYGPLFCYRIKGCTYGDRFVTIRKVHRDGRRATVRIGLQERMCPGPLEVGYDSPCFGLLCERERHQVFSADDLAELFCIALYRSKTCDALYEDTRIFPDSVVDTEVRLNCSKELISRLMSRMRFDDPSSISDRTEQECVFCLWLPRLQRAGPPALDFYLQAPGRYKRRILWRIRVSHKERAARVVVDSVPIDSRTQGLIANGYDLYAGPEPCERLLALYMGLHPRLGDVSRLRAALSADLLCMIANHVCDP